MRFLCWPGLTSSPTSCYINVSRIVVTQWIALQALRITLTTDWSVLPVPIPGNILTSFNWFNLLWSSLLELAGHKGARKEKEEQGRGKHHVLYPRSWGQIVPKGLSSWGYDSGMLWLYPGINGLPAFWIMNLALDCVTFKIIPYAIFLEFRIFNSISVENICAALLPSIKGLTFCSL